MTQTDKMLQAIKARKNGLSSKRARALGIKYPSKAVQNLRNRGFIIRSNNRKYSFVGKALSRKNKKRAGTITRLPMDCYFPTTGSNFQMGIKKLTLIERLKAFISHLLRND